MRNDRLSFRYPLTRRTFYPKGLEQTAGCVKCQDYGWITAQDIQETFSDMLDSWKINTDRVALVLRDSGANMVKDMRLTELTHLYCSHSSACNQRWLFQEESCAGH